MTILAAIGHEDRSSVITVGDDLATAYGDRLVILHVVPTEQFQSYKESVRGIDEFRNASITQEMDSAAQFARRSVIEVFGEFDNDRMSVEGRVGTPAEEILSTAEDIDPRYVVVGGRRRSPTGKALFGSATQQVLLNIDAPAVTVMMD